MLNDHIKEDIKAAADIVEVVGGYVKLRRAGSNWQGLCPFHNEKSPSFNVNPSLGIFKCFGCGESGDVFSFLMKIDGLTFPEAMQALADRYHITIPERTPEKDAAQSHEALLTEGAFSALKFAGMFYYKTLVDAAEAEPARAYLKKRGFTGDTVKKYGLGFAPDRFDALIEAAKREGVSGEYLAEAGLVKQDENGTKMWDTFRGRLLFPIFNPAGKVTGFGGRILTADKKSPKYINSPQTRVYNKSEALYGIHVAKTEMRKAREVILVEGYTDVLQLHQAGILNVVATSGTALTADQLRLMHRYADQILMIYDADEAGQNAMDRGLDLALAEGLSVRILHLPDKEDPDSFVKQFGADSFRAIVKEGARDFMQFLLDRAKEEGKWDEPQVRRATISRILKSISQIRDSITQQTYIQKLSEVSKIGDLELIKELKKVAAAERPYKPRAEAPRREEPPMPDIPYQNDPDDPGFGAPIPAPQVRRKDTSLSPAPSYEKELIRLMITHGYPIIEFVGSHVNADHFENEVMRTLFDDLIERYTSHQPIALDVYLTDDRWKSLVSDMAMERHTPSARHEEKLGKRLTRDGDTLRTVKGELKALKLHYLDRLKVRFKETFDAASDPAERESSSRLLTEVAKERLRIEKTSADHLF
jgi:DNA primase